MFTTIYNFLKYDISYNNAFIGGSVPSSTSHAVMEYEVACVDVTPLAEGRDQADLCAVGLWTDVSVRLLQLPSLTPVHTQLLGGGGWGQGVL